MIAPPAEAARPGDDGRLRLPDPGVLFDARAARLAALAPAHPAPEWLRFLSRVAAGQALAVRDFAPRHARAPGGGPPLARALLRLDRSWRWMLATIASTVRRGPLPPRAEDALRRLDALPPAGLDRLAGAVLAGELGPERAALAPLAGAALQAWLSALAARIDPASVGRAHGACPVCGGAPLAGVVEARTRLRWVTCALCAAEWNVPRVRCALCASEELEVLHADGERGAAVKACRSCRAYLKLFDEEHRSGVDAAADDAATLALDLLVAAEGYRRGGVNVYVSA